MKLECANGAERLKEKLDAVYIHIPLNYKLSSLQMLRGEV